MRLVKRTRSTVSALTLAFTGIALLGAREARAEANPPAQDATAPQSAAPSQDATTPPLEPAPVEPPPPPEPKVAEVEVRVIGNKADALQKVPGAGTLISTKDLKRAQPVDTAEMLRRVPGVQVRQEYSGGSRLDISIRGLESGRSRRVLLLEDGIPMSLNPYSEPDMNYAPAIERYRAIEVVKGSGNILFGPQTLAGTINFVTITPPDHQAAAVDVDAGSYGYVRGLASYGDTIGNARYVVQVLERRGDGFRDQPFNSTDALGKVIVPTGKDGEAMLKLSYHRDEADSDDVGLTSAMYKTDPRRGTLAPHDHLIFNKYDAAIVHEQRFSEDTKLKTILYAYNQPRIWRRQDFTRTPVAGTTYERIVGDTTVPNGAIYFPMSNVVLDRDYSVAGVEPRAEHHVKTWGVEHTIDFGGRALRESAHYQQRSGLYPESFAGSLDFEEKHYGTAFAAYVSDRMAFTDKLLVTPGIRYEHESFRRVVLRQAGPTGVIQDTYDAGDKNVDGIIPGIAIVYGTKVVSVFAGLHVGYAPPRVTSAISPRGQAADVHAEKSLNYELGSRTAPTKWLKLEATAFLSNFSNQVIVGTEPGQDANLTDAGATNIYGVESGGVLAINRIFDFKTIVELGARYTYSHAVFRYGANAGNLLPYSPEHTVTANLDVEHESGVGGQVAYWAVGPQFTDAMNSRKEDVTGSVGPLDPWHVVDTTLHYRHKPTKITIRLTAKNLLDATYIQARRPNGIFTGPYRQFLIGARWEWDGAKREE
jgi:Fe(3+) dicitrate transport protein